MAWFVVIGNGSWESQKVEAEQHLRHRKGVSFYNGKTLVADIPGHKFFRVMECASEAECDEAIGKTLTRHRRGAIAPVRDVATQLQARSARRSGSPSSPSSPSSDADGSEPTSN